MKFQISFERKISKILKMSFLPVCETENEFILGSLKLNFISSEISNTVQIKRYILAQYCIIQNP